MKKLLVAVLMLGTIGIAGCKSDSNSMTTADIKPTGVREIEHNVYMKRVNIDDDYVYFLVDYQGNVLRPQSTTANQQHDKARKNVAFVAY